MAHFEVPSTTRPAVLTSLGNFLKFTTALPFRLIGGAIKPLTGAFTPMPSRVRSRLAEPAEAIGVPDRVSQLDRPSIFGRFGTLAGNVSRGAANLIIRLTTPFGITPPILAGKVSQSPIVNEQAVTVPSFQDRLREQFGRLTTAATDALIGRIRGQTQFGDTISVTPGQLEAGQAAAQSSFVLPAPQAAASELRETATEGGFFGFLSNLLARNAPPIRQGSDPVTGAITIVPGPSSERIVDRPVPMSNGLGGIPAIVFVLIGIVGVIALARR